MPDTIDRTPTIPDSDLPPTVATGEEIARDLARYCFEQRIGLQGEPYQALNARLRDVLGPGTDVTPFSHHAADELRRLEDEALGNYQATALELFRIGLTFHDVTPELVAKHHDGPTPRYEHEALNAIRRAWDQHIEDLPWEERWPLRRWVEVKHGPDVLGCELVPLVEHLTERFGRSWVDEAHLYETDYHEAWQDTALRKVATKDRLLARFLPGRFREPNTDPFLAAARIAPTVWEHRRAHNAAPDLSAFIAEHTGDSGEVERDWLIPGVMTTNDRVIVTGKPGAGKTTLTAQVGVCVGAGLHPFTSESIDPRRVAVVNLEDAPDEMVDALRLTLDAIDIDGEPFVYPRCEGPGGLNLTDPAELDALAAWLAERQIELLVIGPLYKMGADDLADTSAASMLSKALDRLQAEVGCGLLIDAHTGHDGNRPFGSHTWMQWPSFGLHMHPSGRLTTWRLPKRRGAEWPERLREGTDGEMPWVDARVAAEDDLWPQVEEAVRETGITSNRRLAELLDTSHMTISRVKREHAEEWDALVAEMDA